MSMIAVEAATTVVDLLVGFCQKRRSSRVTLFFYFTGIYVRPEWLTGSVFNIYCFRIYVISSIGYITNSQLPAIQLALLA